MVMMMQTDRGGIQSEEDGQASYIHESVAHDDLLIMEVEPLKGQRWFESSYGR